MHCFPRLDQVWQKWTACVIISSNMFCMPAADAAGGGGPAVGGACQECAGAAAVLAADKERQDPGHPGAHAL